MERKERRDDKGVKKEQESGIRGTHTYLFQVFLKKVILKKERLRREKKR